MAERRGADVHQEVEQSVDGELQLVVGAPAQAVMVGAGAWYTHGDAEPVVDAPPLEFCSNTLSLSLSLSLWLRGCDFMVRLLKPTAP